MPLFGSMRANPLMAGQRAGFVPAPKPQERLPQPNAPRRGLFGRIGQAITPDRLMIVGQTLRDIGEGTNGLPDLLQTIQQRPWLEEEMQGRRMDRKREQRRFEAEEAQRVQRQAAIQQYIQTLPPDQQPQAMTAALLDPDGFAARIQGGEWQSDGTVPYRIVNGQTQLGTGAIPHRPRAPLVQYGGIGDDGYDYTDE